MTMPASTVDGSRERVTVGRVAGVFGTRGWLRVVSYTRPPDNLLQYTPWWLHTAAGWQAWQVVAARRHHGGLIVHLAGIDDRAQAAALIRCDIAIERAQLLPAAPGEYYWVDLVGLTVRNRAGLDLGRVRGLFETAAHDVLRVVDSDGRERLIPFVQGVYVDTVNLVARELWVDWHPDD